MSRVTETLCITCSGSDLCYASVDLHVIPTAIYFFYRTKHCQKLKSKMMLLNQAKKKKKDVFLFFFKASLHGMALALERIVIVSLERR